MTVNLSLIAEPIDGVNILPLARFEPTTSTKPPSHIDDDQCSTRRILVPFQCIPSISFANESLMDPRIQVKLDIYQKCGNIIPLT